jgi:hypothetical protein
VFSAELVEWSLVRVTIGEQVSTHAVGLRTRDVDREGGYVLTSPVHEIDRAKSRLTTRNSVYDLVRPIDDIPADLLDHWVRLVVLRARTAPDRIEFLKSDGSGGRSMEQAEIEAATQAWRRL